MKYPTATAAVLAAAAALAGCGAADPGPRFTDDDIVNACVDALVDRVQDPAGIARIDAPQVSIYGEGENHTTWTVDGEATYTVASGKELTNTVKCAVSSVVDGPPAGTLVVLGTQVL